MGILSYIGEALHAGKTFVEGMAWTMKEMFSEPVTVHYPDETADVAPWFRGIPVQKLDLTTGYYKCTSCGLCVDACPVNVITLEWHSDPDTKKKLVDRYAIDMSRCMLCNYCIESCPFDSLVMAMDYELCKTNADNMVYEFEDLLRIGLKYSTADAPDFKPNKLPIPPWVFADITGYTEDDLPEGAFLGMHPLPKRLRAGAAAAGGHGEKKGPTPATAEAPAAEEAAGEGEATP